jgi:hypothetical protein
MLFGRVKTWLFDSLTMVTTIRPPAPPSTSSQKFKDELERFVISVQALQQSNELLLIFGLMGSAHPHHQVIGTR